MDLNNFVIVFDLDDTLYSERSYFFSGLSAVEEFITRIYDIPFEGKIISAHKKGVTDLWGWCCETLGYPEELKQSLIWIYRLHNPKIKLHDGIEKLLTTLKKYKANLVILSDGRSFSQRLKINALNLQDYPLYLSEEYCSIKPDLLRFERIQKRWKGYQYVYIADNPEKDFEGPSNLGWLCLGADWIYERIHQNNENKNFQPEFWLKDPSQVLKILESRL